MKPRSSKSILLLHDETYLVDYDIKHPLSRGSPVKVFTDTRKALSIQCYTHVGVGQN